MADGLFFPLNLVDLSNVSIIMSLEKVFGKLRPNFKCDSKPLSMINRYTGPVYTEFSSFELSVLIEPAR